MGLEMKIFNWALFFIFLYVVDFKGFVQDGVQSWEQGMLNLNAPDRRTVEISDEQMRRISDENYCE